MSEAHTPYLTVTEAAEILRVHPQVIYRMIRAGDLRHMKIGRQYRIPRAAIDELAGTSSAAAS